MTNFNLTQALEILERTPKTLQNMISGLSYNWISVNEGTDTWSVYDIIGHLFMEKKPIGYLAWRSSYQKQIKKPLNLSIDLLNMKIVKANL